MSIDIDSIVDLPAEPAYRPILWPAFVEELLSQYKPPLRAIATYRGMKHALDQVAPLVHTTADLTPVVIAELIKTRAPELSPHTVRSLLRYIRTACNIAIDSGYLRVSPFRRNGINRIVRAGRPEGRRHLTRAEIRALLDLLAADAGSAKGWKAFKARRLQALVATIAYTGLRRNEALYLHVADVDLAGRMIHVRPHGADHRLKTSRSEQMVPMPPALVPILESWMPWRLAAPPGFRMPREVPWLFPSCRRKAAWRDGNAGDKPLSGIKAAGVRAGIGGDINFQMLRRSLATHLRTRFGVGRDLTSRILRHSEAVDDEHYLCDDPDNLRDAVKDVDF